MLNKIKKIIVGILVLFFTMNCLAALPDDPFHTRLQDEQETESNRYAINLYRPTYILPLYYTYSPYYRIYKNESPSDQMIDKAELKFQISFYFSLWHDMFHKPSSLYLAYTQFSYWQAYNHSAFFRETNYEPELFVATRFNTMLFPGWMFRLLNVGFAHESNGKGGSLERSWNRVYADAFFNRGNFIISFKPWWVIRDSSYKKYNNNMTHYMGHGSLLLIYSWRKLTFSLMSRNNIESGFRRGAFQFTCSYPLYKKLRLYFQFFSGYGQSLIEYNHRTNAAGIGFALNDWV